MKAYRRIICLGALIPAFALALVATEAQGNERSLSATLQSRLAKIRETNRGMEALVADLAARVAKAANEVETCIGSRYGKASARPESDRPALAAEAAALTPDEILAALETAQDEAAEALAAIKIRVEAVNVPHCHPDKDKATSAPEKAETGSPGAGSDGSGSTAPTPRGYVPGKECTWTGTWDTNWGAMTLTQDGDTVTGEYEHDNGRIVGTRAGYQLFGQWAEAPSYKGPNDGGKFLWTISRKDCNSLTGTWGYGSDNSSGSWTGKRQADIGSAAGTEMGNTTPPESSTATTEDEKVVNAWTRYRLEVRRSGGAIPHIWLIRTGYRESRNGAALLVTKYPVSVIRNYNTRKSHWSVNAAGEEVIEETQAGTPQEIESLRKRAETIAGQDHFPDREIDARIRKVLDNWN